MKKTNIISIAVLAISLLSSVAHAGNFFRSNPNQGIAIPGLNHIELTPLSQCQLEGNSLRGQLNAAEEEVTALQDQVGELQDQVKRLTPGTCENQCSHSSSSPYEYCVEACNITRGFVDKDGQISSNLSRW